MDNKEYDNQDNKTPMDEDFGDDIINESEAEDAGKSESEQNAGVGGKQVAFILNEKSQEPVPRISGEIEIATPDQRFGKRPKRVGSDEQGKNRKMAEFKRHIRKENRLKRMYEAIKTIKRFFGFNTHNVFFRLFNFLFGMMDGLLNFILITSIVAAIYFAITYLMAGNYLMVAACCAFILTLSYVSEKIQ